MAKEKANYITLLMMRNEITQAAQQSIVFKLFNKDKIDRFFKYNAMRIQLADEKLGRLIKRFVKHDADDKPIQLEQQAGGRVKWEYNSAEDEKAFAIEYNEFMNREVVIEL
jgi:hypothetical protein